MAKFNKIIRKLSIVIGVLLLIEALLIATRLYDQPIYAQVVNCFCLGTLFIFGRLNNEV